MVTTALDYWESDYAVGRRHTDFTGRNSTPDVGAMNDRDAQMYWRVIRGGFIIHREHKILDFQWLGLNGDIVYARAVDAAGNAGDWESYTYSVTANEDADWVRYVDTGGNDTTGDGSEGNPWATGAKAVTEAQAALTSGQVGVIFFSDDQTHSFTSRAYAGSNSTSCLLRFVRKGGGTNRPDLSFSANITGFTAGKKGVFHVDGCDVTGAHTNDTNPAFDLVRSGGVAADQDPWNVMVVDCDVTNFGQGINCNWGLTSVDRDTGGNDFVALENVSFTGTRWFHVYGFHATNRTMFRNVELLTHTAFSNNPFRVFRVGRMYCEDVLFNTGDTGTMRLSVTAGANDYDAMRECTFNRVRMIGTNSGANSIALQPDAAMSGSGIIRDVRFVDCHLTTAHYAIQADQGGSNAVNTSRIDYLECQSTGNAFLIVGGSGSVSHTHNSIRLRNCATTRMSYAGGAFIILNGAASRYAADSLTVEGCWMLWGAGNSEPRVLISTSIAVADLANIVAACNYNHLGKTDGNSLGWLYAGGSVSRATWSGTYGFDGNSSATINTTFDLTNDGTVPADADFRLTADTGPLGGTGVPLPLGVSIDADGFLRSATAPDAGPYEFGATDTPEDPSFSAPAAPTSFGATETTSTTAQVSWTDNASDETAYEVEYKLASDGSWTLWSDAIAADAETTVITGLTAGSLYDVRIRATNGSGDSSWLTGQFTTTAATTALIDYHFATATSLPAGITFSRASAATMFDSAGLIKSVASGTARIGYGSAGGRKGLLVEGARTNLLTYSEQFGNAAWTKALSTVSANSATSPDGAATADKAIVNNGTSLGLASGAGPRTQISKAASATTYTASVYFKAAEHSDLFLMLAQSSSTVGNAVARFRASDCSVVTSASVSGTFTAASASIASVGNGWCRAVLTATSDTDTVIGVRAFPSDQSATTGDGTSGIYVWGAQLEAATFPSTYIPTEGSTASRAGDRAYLTLSPAMAAALSNGGTMAVEYSLIGGESTNISGSRVYGSADNGTGDERVFIYNASGASAVRVTVGGGLQAVPTVSGTVPIDDPKAAAASWALNSVGFAQNGVAATRDTSATMPTVTALGIGCRSDTTSQAYAVIHRIRVWTSPSDDTRLEDLAELSTLSSGTGTRRTGMGLGLRLGL